MKKSISFATILSLAFTFFLICTALAQENKTVPKKDLQVEKNSQAAPQKVLKGGKIPVMVVYSNTDSLGRRLVFNMRERFNSSNLFRLSGYSEKKIKIVVKSQDEFQARPGLCSIYSIVWTFSYAEDVLSNYLGSETGIVMQNSLPEQAKNLVARTDEVYSEYGYLFEE